MYASGLPHESCSNYQAKNMECTPEWECRNCKPEGGCAPVKNFTKYYADQYGTVSGEENMLNEIFNRGLFMEVCPAVLPSCAWR